MIADIMLSWVEEGNWYLSNVPVNHFQIKLSYETDLYLHLVLIEYLPISMNYDRKWV